MSKPIGIFGGTFDPIHNGHIQVAIEAYKQLGLQEVRLVPCRQSPFKPQPEADENQRSEMIRLATTGYNYLKLDQRELSRPGLSYTIDTLESFRNEFPSNPLCLIMSQDAFTKFNHWHNWERILESAHIVVANRPDSQPPNFEIAQLLQERLITNPSPLQEKIAGCIIMLNMTPNPISATEIRASAKKKGDLAEFVSTAVADYIYKNGLYS